jgi:hypothetical protein
MKNQRGQERERDRRSASFSFFLFEIRRQRLIIIYFSFLFLFLLWEGLDGIEIPCNFLKLPGHNFFHLSRSFKITALRDDTSLIRVKPQKNTFFLCLSFSHSSPDSFLFIFSLPILLSPDPHSISILLTSSLTSTKMGM